MGPDTPETGCSFFPGCGVGSGQAGKGSLATWAPANRSEIGRQAKWKPETGIPGSALSLFANL